MMSNKWRFIILAILIASVAIYQWVNTTPTWYLYYKEFDMVATLEEFDALMVEVQDDVTQNFGIDYPVDSEAAREEVRLFLEEGYCGFSSHGYIDTPDNLKEVAGFFVYGGAWVWDGSDISPNWALSRVWKDYWRQFDYGSPKTKEPQLCMMGFTPTPRAP